MKRSEIKYGVNDPWVWCSNCQALLRVDPMDASCRLCDEFHVLSQDEGDKVRAEFETEGMNKLTANITSILRNFIHGSK